MASEKRLSSVCHGIAHHAVSGLSYIHPHLRQACRAVGESSVVIDLCNTNPCPEPLFTNQRLQNALLSVQTRFLQILQSEGFSASDIQEASLFFEFTPEFPDDYCSNCHASLVSATGKQFAHAVNYLGASITPNTSFKRDALTRAP
jgi:hypothetical protein